MNKNHPVSFPQSNTIPIPSLLMPIGWLSTLDTTEGTEQPQPQPCPLTQRSPSAGGQHAGGTHWPQHPQHLGRSTGLARHSSSPQPSSCSAQAPQGSTHREGRTGDPQRITELFRLGGTLRITLFSQYSGIDYLQVTDSN